MTTVWTKVNKASGTTWTKVPKPSTFPEIVGGDPIGLLLLFTYSTVIPVDNWSRVPKAIGDNWTRVPKAT